MDTLILGAAIVIVFLIVSARARQDFAAWLREDNGGWLAATLTALFIVDISDGSWLD